MSYTGVRKGNECQHTVSILGISDHATNHDGISLAYIQGTATQWVEHMRAIAPSLCSWVVSMRVEESESRRVEWNVSLTSKWTDGHDVPPAGRHWEEPTVPT